MTQSTPISDLEAFARECIDADRYPEDTHVFRLFECTECGGMCFEVCVEHHTGSKNRDFKGVIWGDCVECGSRERLFSFTGEHRKPLREVRQVCKCGNKSFAVGECERIEGDQGLTGFFDEGVIVGKCRQCGRMTPIVYTD